MILETVVSTMLTVVIQHYLNAPPKVKRLPAPPRPIGAYVIKEQE